jgi:putative transport protein
VRQIGLLFFMAAVGTSAGAHLVETFEQNGAELFIAGALITLIPMIVAVVVAKLFFRFNMLTLLGALAGSMTSTPGLAAVDNMTDSNAPTIAYATVYPVAMVLLIVVVNIL